MMLTAIAAAAALTSAGIAPVDAAILDGLPVVEATLTAHGSTQHCTGPTLVSVLEQIGAPLGKELRGGALAGGVLARGRDGYTVLFSLGELDPGIGGVRAIIATSCDGKPLSEKDGPYRLIVPADKRAARSVRQLETLEAVGIAQEAEAAVEP